MMRSNVLVGLTLSGAIAVGCYTGGNISPESKSGSSGSNTTSTSVDGSDPAAAATFDGLPCDVAKVLADKCSSCHGAKLGGGAPNHMTSYDDLVAASQSDPSKTVAELSVVRMQASKNPMPPDGADAADAAVLQAWIKAGAKQSTCSDPSIIPADPVDDPYATATVCTSKSTWTRGDRGSTSMHPGVACIDCHDSDRGPSYVAAGTVYPTAHEPDDCNGSNDASLQVVITDKNGKTYTQTVNSVGNFYFSSRTTIATPYTAKIVSGSKSRAMQTAQTDGDCNKCHTEKGTEKAPGRLMAP